jgi:hypothetical protein
MLSQPRCQFPLNPLSVCYTEAHRHRRPPIWKAAVADELAAVEERARVGAAEKFPALQAALDTKQG